MCYSNFQTYSYFYQPMCYISPILAIFNFTKTYLHYEYLFPKLHHMNSFHHSCNNFKHNKLMIVSPFLVTSFWLVISSHYILVSCCKLNVVWELLTEAYNLDNISAIISPQYRQYWCHNKPLI